MCTLYSDRPALPGLAEGTVDPTVACGSSGGGDAGTDHSVPIQD